MQLQTNREQEEFSTELLENFKSLENFFLMSYVRHDTILVQVTYL